MSGDTGFFSGTRPLLAKLEGFDVQVIAGVSSLSYFSACLGIPWHDACIVSAHGRDCDVAGAVQTHEKTFAITGGKIRAQEICRELAARGMGDVTVHVGERLSYDDERIVGGTAAEVAQMEFGDLAVLMALNAHPIKRSLRAPALDDSAFARNLAPMTKEEVREVSIAKLHLRKDDTVWDIGAGTGSVSVEAAYAVAAGRVFAVEKNPEAIDVLKRNKARFGLTNIQIVQGKAPEALADLPAPDRVFVGGSSGNLVEIVAAALAANPKVRIVITGITLELTREVLCCLEKFAFANVDIAQVGVARCHEVGGYHMMRGQNPILIVSADAPEATPDPAQAYSEAPEASGA